MDTYEKKYNEALKRAKAAIDIAADKDLVKGVATTIFPELAESEDEKVWQWIREHINHDGTNMFDKAVAWLEKQKEPSLRDFIDDFPYSDEQKEQKPVEWSEKEQEIIDCSVELLEKDGHHSFASQLKSISPKPIPKWNEEDVKMFQLAIRCASLCKQLAINHQTEGLGGDDITVNAYESVRNWLSNRFRLIVDIKQEWSEEDEAFLKVAIAICNRCSHKYIADWLKSLSPSWKPSEEDEKMRMGGKLQKDE